MKFYKTHNTLYRLSNNGKVKDVKVTFGKIETPDNPYNILSETERQHVELELSK